MKILVNTPTINNPRGGVANHFSGLKYYWNEQVAYNFIGDRNHIPGPVIFPYDIIKFIIKCLYNNPDMIVLNPSLGKNALRRDAFFLRTAKMLGIKTVVFFHGWNKILEESISQNPTSFRNTFNKADAFIVLAFEFKQKLQDWGISKTIYLTTTKVDDKLLKNVHIKNEKSKPHILFLSRVEAEKGIYIAINAFEIIQKKIPEAKFIVAGIGNALQSAQELVANKGIPNVSFTGKISGKELQNAFMKASIYILPTSHGEGMPTSILEAMAFGLPIVTRPVGGINDFFQNKKMGVLVDSLEPSDFAKAVLKILEKPELMKEISCFNSKFSSENFIASKVTSRLENIFSSIHS